MDEWAEKLEVVRSMKSGRGVNFLVWYLTREARGVAIQMITACRVTHISTRWIDQVAECRDACGQTCGGHGVSLHEARPCIQTGRGHGVTLNVINSCIQPCGARGAAAHAYGAMQSDTRAATRAATRLVPDWLMLPINSPRLPLI